MIRSNAGVAHYAGLTTCGSIWACPVCSAKIRTRATEISEATAAWDRAGNSVYMITFTTPHDMGMKLRPLISAIADGFRAVIAGRGLDHPAETARDRRHDPGHGSQRDVFAALIATEEVGGEDLAVIHGDDWRHIVRVPACPR